MPMAATLWHRGEKELLADGLARMYDAAFVVILPACGLMACFSDVMMATLWRRDIFDAPVAFNIVVIGAVVYVVSLLNFHALAGTGQAKQAFKVMLWSLGVNVALNVVLIYHFGIRGAATATVISHLVAMKLGRRALRKLLGVPQAGNSDLAAVIGLVPVAGAAFLVRCTGVFLEHPLLVAIGASVVLYVSCVGVLCIFGFGRLGELVSIVVRGRARQISPK
jgi:O-antigen/teichoic acid export membrane protein